MKANDPETVINIMRDRVYDSNELLQITFAAFDYGETIKQMRATETQKELAQSKK